MGPGRTFYAVGGAALALLPLVMVLSNRSSPLIVGIAALSFLAGRCCERSNEVLTLLRGPLLSALGLACLAFLGWAVVSIGWSPFPALSLRMLGEFLPTLLSAYILACLAPGRLPAFAPALGCAAIVGAALYVVVDLALGLPVEQSLGRRFAAFVFNRPVLTFDLLAGPLALLLWRRGMRKASLATFGFACLGVLRSISGAAAMGLLAGSAMAVVARALPHRVAVSIAGIGLGLALALAPVEGDLLSRVMPESAHQQLTQSSSRARVAIARSFGAAVAEAPWLGAGFGTSARFAEAPVAAGLPPEMRLLLGVGHPHNSFLQIWAELGVPGAFLAALALMLMLARIAPLPAGDRTVALGVVACAAAIAFVEHNAWAAWWTAGLGAAITWARAARARPDTSATDLPA